MEDFNFNEAEFDMWMSEEKLLKLMNHYPEGLTEDEINNKMIDWYNRDTFTEMVVFDLLKEVQEPKYTVSDRGARAVGKSTGEE